MYVKVGKIGEGGRISNLDPQVLKSEVFLASLVSFGKLHYLTISLSSLFDRLDTV